MTRAFAAGVAAAAAVLIATTSAAAAVPPAGADVSYPPGADGARAAARSGTRADSSGADGAVAESALEPVEKTAYGSNAAPDDAGLIGEPVPAHRP